MCIHRISGHAGAVVVAAVANHRPTVVAPRPDDVDLISAERTMLTSPRLPSDRMKSKSLNGAMADGVDFWQVSILTDKRIVSGNGTVIVHT